MPHIMEPHLSSDFTPRTKRFCRKVKRKWLWRQLPCALTVLLYVFSLSLVQVVQPDPKYVTYEPVRASNGVFVTVASYLIDGEAVERLKGPFRASEDETLLMVLGIGEFGQVPQNASGEWRGISPSVPLNLTCAMDLKNETVESFGLAHLHSTGTAFEHSISSRRSVRYFRERTVLLSCVVPKHVLKKMFSGYEHGLLPTHGEASAYPVRIQSDSFDTGSFIPKVFLSQKIPVKDREKSVLCSTPLYGLSGTRWLTEWLIFHHFIQGFDKIHLYFTQEMGAKAIKTIAYLSENYPWVIAHNWSSVLRGETGLDPLHGVGNGVITSAGFERGQRLARTDCFLRNRGHKWLGFLDVDEYFYTSPLVNFKRDVLPMCESARVCRFSSVTIYPLKTGDSRMFLESLSPMCEGKCIQGFNCGKFNYGREKYLIKASRETENPGTVLAIHSVSDSHTFSDSFGHTLIPDNVSFVKHFNPTPYAKTGGYFKEKPGTECPFTSDALRTIRSVIENDLTLKQMYDRDHDEEQFLKLERADDPWRFNSSQR